MSPLGCSTTAAVGRRYRKAPTAEEAAEQREAWNQAQQEMADRQAAVAAARSATLQRNRAAHCVGQLFGYEEDLHIGSDEGYVADDMDDDGDVGPSNGGQQRQPSGGPGHGERRLRYEQAFQRENEKAVQYRTLLAAEHAAAERRDMGQQLAAVQQKVVAYSGHPIHPACPGAARAVSVISWRPVMLRCMAGTGAIEIPTFRCVMGLLSTHAAPLWFGS